MQLAIDVSFTANLGGVTDREYYSVAFAQTIININNTASLFDMQAMIPI